MDVDLKNQNKDQESSLDIGALLVEARENKNWSTEDIASQMNLSLIIIEKIESNQFDQDLPLTFVRGYIGSYAKKVGLDVEPLCMAFDSQMNSVSPPITKIKSVANYRDSHKEMNSNHRLFKLMTSLIVLFLVSFATWELWKKISSKETEAKLSSNDISLKLDEPDAVKREINPLSLEKVETTSLIESNPNQANLGSVNQDTEKTIDEELSIQKESLKEDSPENSLSNNTVAEKVSTQFVFSADCWVKITDGLGDVLAVGVKTNGKVMQLKGVLPISVILGEPSAVSLSVNDSPYDLSLFPAGKRAKFKIE